MVVRAGRIHTIHAFDFLAIHFLIWESSVSDWDFFHQNLEKCILFGIGNGSFYGTRIYGQKNPWTHHTKPYSTLWYSTILNLFIVHQYYLIDKILPKARVFYLPNPTHAPHHITPYRRYLTRNLSYLNQSYRYSTLHYLILSYQSVLPYLG